jgi:hypothetical protein
MKYSKCLPSYIDTDRITPYDNTPLLGPGRFERSWKIWQPIAFEGPGLSTKALAIRADFCQIKSYPAAPFPIVKPFQRIQVSVPIYFTLYGRNL